MMCSLLYYWDNTIAQVMYVYYSDTTCRYHFCAPWRCNANGERLMWLFWYKYYGYIWMIIFVLLQVCLGNAGVSFIKPKLINVGEVLSVLLGSKQCIWKQIFLQTLPPQVYSKIFVMAAQWNVVCVYVGLKLKRKWVNYLASIFSTKVARHFIFSVKCLNKPNMRIDFS